MQPRFLTQPQVMSVFRRSFVLGIAWILAAPAAADDTLFETQVAPILRRACVGCHGEEKQKGGLDLSSLEALREGGKSGDAVVPGKSAASLLLDRVTRRDKKIMPPRKAGKPLSEEDVAVLRRWIDGTLTAAPAKKEPPPASATATTTTEAPRIGAVAFSPDGASLAIASESEVYVIDSHTGAETARLSGHAELVRQLHWSADGKLLVAAGGMPGVGGELIFWNTESWQKAATTPGHRDAIYGLSLHPDGSRVATASYDKLIKLWAWDGTTASEAATLKDHIDAVADVAFTRDGRQLVSVAGDRTVKVWGADGTRLLTFSDATKALRTIAVSPNSDEIAAGGDDQMIRIWSTGAEAGLLRFKFAHGNAVLKLAYTPDGERLVSAGEDRLIKVWNQVDLSEVTVMEEQPDWVLGLDVGPAGERVAVGRYDGSWAIYETATGKALLASEHQSSRPAPPPEENLVDFEGATNRTDESGKFLVEAVQGGITVPPFLTSLSSRTATRDSTHTFELRGNNLADAELWFSHDGITGRVVENEQLEKPDRRATSGRNELIDHSVPHRLKIEVTISDEVPTGDYQLFALTPSGVTNSQNLFVEAAVELTEEEPNDALREAGDMSFEEVLLGKMDRRGDVDLFRFPATSGDELVFYIRSKSLGSGLNALLAIVDSNGKELARSDAEEFGNLQEARVAHRFTESGEYFLQLTDRNFGEGGFYRLYGGRIPFVTSFFPPGLQGGESAKIHLEGFNVGDTPVTIEAPSTNFLEGGPETLAVPLGDALRGAKLALGELPDQNESEPNDSPQSATQLEAPSIANGVLDKGEGNTGDRDHYRFHATKGQRFTIDIVAGRIGSSLDSVVSVLDAQGRRIERAVLRSVAQTEVVFRGAASSRRAMRMKAWNELRVNDLVMVGSEVLKLRKLPDYPDEDVEFFSVGGRRVGLYDTTPEFQPIGTPVYKIETLPAGTQPTPNGMPIVRLHYDNDDGGMPEHKRDSLVHFTAPRDGDYIVRVEDVHGRSGKDYYYRLQVRPARPRFRLRLENPMVNVPLRGGAPLQVGITRLDGFNGPVHLDAPGDLPPGIRILGVTIPPDRDTALLTIWADAEATSTAPRSGPRIRATAEIDGQTVTRETKINMLRVIGMPDVSIAVETPRIRLVPGKTTKVTVTATRHNGFEGRIPLDVLNLPHGVLVMDTGLNGILLPAHESKRTIILHAEPFVAPQLRRIYVTARTNTRSPVQTTLTGEPAVLEIGPPGEIVQRAF